MEEPQAARQIICFGVFEVDLRAGELHKSGVRVKLQEQPFQVLAMLLERAGEVVTREELHQKLWGADTFVDFDHGLATAIKKIREALGDDADNPRFIETLPRRGYRFIAPVEVREHPRGAPVSGTPTREGREGPPLPRRWALVLAAATLTALVAVLIGLNIAGLRDRLVSHFAGPLRIESIVVLPLENLSRDPEQEYFADGMTEALISNLGKIKGLRVISRTSAMRYKAARKPLPEIARELRVDVVVEGSVVQSGTRLDITVRLVHAASDRQLWTESYRRDLRDVLAVQNEIARAVAREIDLTVLPPGQASLARTRRVDPAAHEAYLRGRFFWHKRTREGIAAGLKYFQQAVQIDSAYALAYAGIADCYSMAATWFEEPGASAKAKEAARKAVELDDRVAEGHTALAYVLEAHEWDWGGAEREFQLAITLNPNYATAHHWYGLLLSSLRRPNEALAEVKRALEVDPYSLHINSAMGRVLLYARRYDEAIAHLKKTVEMYLDNPVVWLEYGRLAQAYVERGMYQEAIECTRPWQDIVTRAQVYAAMGETRKAERILYSHKREWKGSGITAVYLAKISARLGEHDEARAWLERGFRTRIEQMVYVNIDPAFDPLRRMNFPP